jgi:hypothetical protein
VKPLYVILICICTSALTAAAFHLLTSDSRGDAVTSSSSDALFNANSRMAELEEDLLASEAKMGEMKRLLEQAQGVAAIQPGEIARLRADLAALESRMAQGGAAAGVKGPMKIIGDDGEEYVASAGDLETFIAKEVEDRVKTSAKKSRRNQFKQWAPFARMGMMRSLRRNAKKLNLNPEQTKRLEESATKSFDAIMPRMGILMDAEATPEERETALTEVRSEMETANSEAASFMDPEQFSEYEEMQSQQNQQFEQWLEALGGTNAGGSGTPPGSPATPATGADG